MHRNYCAPKATPGVAGPPPDEAAPGSPAAAAAGEAAPAGDATQTSSTALSAVEEGRQPGELAVHDEDAEENLPPLAFEPGVAGVAQKGISAVVIAFGAAAFGACVWGASQALFPSASSTQTIYSEAFDKVYLDGEVAYALGSPLKAYGADRGGDNRGRRNAMERWEVEEGGEELSIVRFTVAGPQGTGRVVAQVPRNRKRGEFRYIIFEHKRRAHHVLDNRAELAPSKPIAEPPPALAGSSGSGS